MSLTPTKDPQVIVADAVASISHIATLPEITLKIIELVENPRSTAQDLHKVISNDPALVARILKVVNSAFYGLPGQIGSINRAIVLLGLNAVKNIVIAASLANGGANAADVAHGLQYFAKMNKIGNLIPLIAVTGTLASGETPITIEWDYNALANRDKLDGNPSTQVIVPTTGVVAGVYIQAISAYAPHPNAAKLWMEYIYSDEGQLIWLKGYGHPVRFNDMAKRNVVPAALAAKLPPSAAYAKAVFPTLDQQVAAGKAVAEGWDDIVGADIQKK